MTYSRTRLGARVAARTLCISLIIGFGIPAAYLMVAKWHLDHELTLLAQLKATRA